MRGEGRTFLEKGPPLKLPLSFPKTFIREDGRAGDIVGLPLAAGLRRCSCGRGLRHGKSMKGREQEDFLLPVFWSCGLQAAACHNVKQGTIGLGDGFDFWAVDGALSANLCWERDSTDAGWPTTYAPHVRCPICPERDLSAAVRSATGTGHTGQSKSFFGVGERRGAVLPKNAPPPLVIIPQKVMAYFKPRSRSRLLTAIWPMVATAPLVEDEQWEPMTRLSRAYQRASCGGSCSNTSRPAP